ncbi:MAG TPA: signal peptidase II [Parachlamydiaceae bacterium]|nr:signal peptidase II [Parachlamydiaceae bacterium]
MHVLKKSFLENVWLKAAVGFLLLLTDIFTKFLTASFLPLMSGNAYPYKGIPVFKNFLGIEFSIVHATNKGAAWGFFADFQTVLIAFRILLIIGLITYLLFYNKNYALQMPLILVGFGAFGNILDYFLYGHVIDMFHFVFWGYSYPVFNIADAAICIGIFWLFLVSFKGD